MTNDHGSLESLE